MAAAFSLCTSGLFAARIGLVDLDQKSDFEASLVATLSSDPDMELVERSSMAKLVDEKRLLDLVSGSKLRQLGGLLNADGLLIIETIPVRNSKPRRTIRLVSTKTGVCIFADLVPDIRPGDADFNGWLDWLKRRIQFSGHHLGAAADAAIPVSLLNIRATTDSPGNREMERAMSRLLEQALSSDPGLILLERRALRDVAFEHSLDASDVLPLAGGTSIIDGSFQQSGDGLEVTIRLRKMEDHDARLLKFKTSTDLSVAIKEIHLEIRRALGTVKEEYPSHVEAEEFLSEAKWALRAGLFSACLEAADAAEALGLDKPEVFSLRVDAVYQALDKNISGGDRSVKQERDLIDTALASLESHTRLTGKSNLKLLCMVLDRASAFLADRDKENAPGYENLRAELRKLSGMQADGDQMPISMTLSAKHAATWAQDFHELLAFYKKLLASHHKWLSGLLGHFPRSRDEALGVRFQGEPEAVSAWNNLMEELLNDPKVRCRILFLQSRDLGSKSGQDDYRKFLEDLRRNATELAATGDLGILLEVHSHSDSICQRERAELMIALLENLPDYEPRLSLLALRTKVPEDLWPDLAKAFTSYRTRFSGKDLPAKDRINREQRLSDLSRSILLQNPGAPLSLETKGLVVSKLWHPFDWAPPDVQSFLYGNGNILVRPDGVWLNSSKSYLQGTVLQVTLPTFEVRKHSIQGYELASSGDNILLKTSEPYGADSRVIRYDPRTGVSKSLPLPESGDLVTLGTRVFCFAKSQMWEISPDSSARLVFSARRRPAETPLDDRKISFAPVALFYGFQYKPLISVFGEGAIREFEGKWESVQKIHWPSVSTFGEESVVVSPWDGAFLYGPGHEKPLRLLDGSHARGEKTAYGWTDPVEVPQQGDCAYRPKELFRLEKDLGGKFALRWWHEGGPSEGLVIPLSFHLAKSSEESVKTASQYFLEHYSLERLLKPDNLGLFAAESGLVLASGAYGFWFIPNADLEAKKEEWKAQNKEPIAKIP